MKTKPTRMSGLLDRLVKSFRRPKCYADWKGAERRRFCWKRFRFAYGRMCYKTDCNGDVLKSWWEWTA